MATKLLSAARASLRRSGLPLVVFAAGLLASLWLWGELRRSQRHQLAVLVTSAAEETAHAVASRFAAQELSVAQLAELWARLPPGAASAAAPVDRLPEFERLVWIDLQHDAIWVAQPGQQAIRAGPREREALAPLLADARGATGRALLGPEQEPGGPRYHVVAPAQAGDERGILIATASLDSSIAPIVRPLLGRYETQLLWRGGEVAKLGEAAGGVASESARLPIPGNDGLEIRISVGPTLQRAVVDSAPLYALGAGVSASTLLAGLLFAYRALHDRSAEVELAHRETEAEAARARQAERDAFGLANELEARVAARTRQLADAVEELEAFNYSVSHDLRSPLGAVINFCAILTDEHGPALGAQGAELLERIGRSAHAAVEMMDGLLELSQLGRASLSLQRVDMEVLARESMEHALGVSGARDVRFEVGPLPPASADPALLRLVFSNLLRNAIKYTRSREKPRIAISGRRLGAELVYAVSDDGVGFDMRYAGKLFRPFHRLHGSEDFPGSGIGLAIVARAVRRHGGRVWAEAEPGRGATFSFALPEEPASEEAPL